MALQQSTLTDTETTIDVVAEPRTRAHYGWAVVLAVVAFVATGLVVAAILVALAGQETPAIDSSFDQNEHARQLELSAAEVSVYVPEAIRFDALAPAAFVGDGSFALNEQSRLAGIAPTSWIPADGSNEIAEGARMMALTPSAGDDASFQTAERNRMDRLAP